METPLVAWLRSRATVEKPRHIVLTGSAGDGKTFSIASARQEPWPFYEVLDASDRPPSDLAGELSHAVEAGRRLLLAINRGQLERLRRHVASGDDDPLPDLLRRVSEQLQPRTSWELVDPIVGVVDLGWMDSTSEAIAGAVLRKVATAGLEGGIAGPTKHAARLAQEALGEDSIRRRVLQVLRGASGGGQHVTMRQLWAWASFLLTGGRREDDLTPVGLQDLLGARVFNDSGLAPLRRGVGVLRGDPASIPQPQLTLAALTTSVLPSRPGVPAGLPVGESPGPHFARVAWLHALGLGERPSPDLPDVFESAVRSARAAPFGDATVHAGERLLEEIMRALGHSSHLLWERLCFDSARISAAPAVATHKLNQDPRVAVPTPPPWCCQALGDAWTPPFVWLGVETQSDRATIALRPDQLQRLSVDNPDAADEQVFRRWLGRALHVAGRPLAGAEVQRPGEREILRVRPVSEHQVAISWSGS